MRASILPFCKKKKISGVTLVSLGVAYFTAHRALFTRGRAVKGETVLVHGAR